MARVIPPSRTRISAPAQQRLRSHLACAGASLEPEPALREPGDDDDLLAAAARRLEFRTSHPPARSQHAARACPCRLRSRHAPRVCIPRCREPASRMPSACPHAPVHPCASPRCLTHRLACWPPTRSPPLYSPDDEARGWKLFTLAPRMLLYRSASESRIPPAELDRRVELFRAGSMDRTPARSRRGACAPRRARSRWNHRRRSGPPRDCTRPPALVQLVELSSAARALTAEPLAPGNADTLAELHDPARRPPVPYAPLADATLHCRPHQACPFPEVSFPDGLRSARRGSAAGPSGATNEHLRILYGRRGGRSLAVWRRKSACQRHRPSRRT